jgi:serine/threonine-protein kinase
MTQPEDDLPPTMVDGNAGSTGDTVPGGPEAGIDLDAPASEDGEDRFADPDLDAIESLGRFRVERFLGAGGMGKVFRAFDRKLERAVALKLLTLPDAHAAKRFLAEARAQARVDHPNVCQVFDAGEVKGRRFIVMQLLEGRTLSKVADDLTLEQKVAVVRSICEGVQAAHKLGLVHRDLKASNVIVVEVDGERHPYVVDFGLAREVGPGGATVTGAAAGTPWYMAPEQVAGAAVDRRTDVYALGVLLYRLPAPGIRSKARARWT